MQEYLYTCLDPITGFLQSFSFIKSGFSSCVFHCISLLFFFFFFNHSSIFFHFPSFYLHSFSFILSSFIFLHSIFIHFPSFYLRLHSSVLFQPIFIHSSIFLLSFSFPSTSQFHLFHTLPTFIHLFSFTAIFLLVSFILSRHCILPSTLSSLLSQATIIKPLIPLRHRRSYGKRLHYTGPHP
ncbi:unnamed protein product [Acanthosepion pharaonis]|uniref:Uncharacterized protein n=1 Tax=Acanthosepion pharaonis TaxID=158019 RepID=A0A812EWN5_ACAPH|nr:unnamed protein product [Sepia pharaonis]